MNRRTKIQRDVQYNNGHKYLMNWKQQLLVKLLQDIES